MSLTISVAQADSIDVSAQGPWESCSFCHGFDGASASERFPNLAGQQKAYLKAQLYQFRNGVRSNDDGVMQTNAATLNESEIEQVAEYFSQQQRPSSAPLQAGPQAAAVYRNGIVGDCAVTACKTCHGEQALGAGAIPALAGQHAGYLKKQLSDFAFARRGQSSDTMDHGFVRCLSPAQQNQLSEFLNAK